MECGGQFKKIRPSEGRQSTCTDMAWPLYGAYSMYPDKECLSISLRKIPTVTKTWHVLHNLGVGQDYLGS